MLEVFSLIVSIVSIAISLYVFYIVAAMRCSLYTQRKDLEKFKNRVYDVVDMVSKRHQNELARLESLIDSLRRTFRSAKCDIDEEVTTQN